MYKLTVIDSYAAKLAKITKNPSFNNPADGQIKQPKAEHSLFDGELETSKILIYDQYKPNKLRPARYLTDDNLFTTLNVSLS